MIRKILCANCQMKKKGGIKKKTRKQKVPHTLFVPSISALKTMPIYTRMNLCKPHVSRSWSDTLQIHRAVPLTFKTILMLWILKEKNKVKRMV